MSFPSTAFFESAAAQHGLADKAIVTLAGNNARAVDGKFTSQYVEPFGMVEATGPVFTCAQSQFADGLPGQNDAIEITQADGLAVSLVYRVKTAKPNTPQIGDITLLLKV